MSEFVERGALRELLTTSYAEIKRRLARRLGSPDAASDVLHETYLRLERFDGLAPVANPQAYLLRMAFNVATDFQRAQKRWLTAVEIDDLWRLGDDPSDPETIVEGQSELALFKAALSELSPRRRAILVAARVHGETHDAIAERLGVSARTVQFELRYALAHCARRLDRKVVRRFGPPPADPS